MNRFFSKNIRVYAIFNDLSFNDTLTNNIISFEQLGPDISLISQGKHIMGNQQRCLTEVLLVSTHSIFSLRNVKIITDTIG